MPEVGGISVAAVVVTTKNQQNTTKISTQAPEFYSLVTLYLIMVFLQ